MGIRSQSTTFQKTNQIRYVLNWESGRLTTHLESGLTDDGTIAVCFIFEQVFCSGIHSSGFPVGYMVGFPVGYIKEGVCRLVYTEERFPVGYGFGYLDILLIC